MRSSNPIFYEDKWVDTTTGSNVSSRKSTRGLETLTLEELDMRCQATTRWVRQMIEKDGQNMITLQTTKNMMNTVISGIATTVGTQNIMNAGVAAKMAVDSHTKAKINHDGNNDQLREAKWQLLQLLSLIHI